MRNIFLSNLVISFILLQPVLAQTQEVTFRYIPGSDQEIFRAFLPGEFNNWGPNSSGRISTNAPSLMTRLDSLDQWIYSTPLQIGSTYQYKVHIHLNGDGSNFQWITDPLNPRINAADNDNSVITIRDPMVFQLAREANREQEIEAVSAGLFSTETITDVDFWINGIQREGLSFYNSSTGIFRYALENRVQRGAQFKIRVTDELGRQDSLEVGELQVPVSWGVPGFKTVQETISVTANVTRQDGTIDSLVTTALLSRGGGNNEEIDVSNGRVELNEELQLGENTFLLQATIGGQLFTSDTLTITRIVHPLDAFVLDPTVGGSGFAFSINGNPTGSAPDGMVITWDFDERNSTAGINGLVVTDQGINGTATGSGELYFEVEANKDGDVIDRQRVAVIVEENGIVRSMSYEETPSWVNQAVVYEIFPLSFGPEADGTESSPGNKFKEITRELDYISKMGFNVIWFMPVMKNQIMDQISGGYNIIDFYNVDPKLGTNDDFKALVQRAHELGIKIVMDITPNHSSPRHPWVNALRENGDAVPPASFVQTTPSSHNRGLDNRGSNLQEVWQSDEGGNLYRKYDGFGDLANLDWDNDDLQAEYLNILAHWIHEFDIDGWRFDVYWGPWRRYGPERFGRPIRELMKRIKPDSWLLGEIAGTGSSTEVYYTDDDVGNPIEGGIDAGYDWVFYFDAVRGTYGNIGNYDSKARNGDFWPGPNARYFRFLENHDEERIGKLMASNSERILPLTGMLLTTTGIPMIYQGQEVNFGNVSGDERRVSVNWNTARNTEFAEVHQRLIHARRTFKAFGTQQLSTLQTSEGVYVFTRPYLDENAIVMINFTNEDKIVRVNPISVLEMSTDGPVSYTDIFADSSIIDQEMDGIEVTVPRYETVIFIANSGEEVDVVVPELPQLPFGAVYTSVDNEVETEVQLALNQNYPNPFKQTTTITYTIPRDGIVSLIMYDLLGREVERLVHGYQRKGRYTEQFDSRTLTSGIYFVKLTTEKGTIVRQVALVK